MRKALAKLALVVPAVVLLAATSGLVRKVDAGNCDRFVCISCQYDAVNVCCGTCGRYYCECCECGTMIR